MYIWKTKDLIAELAARKMSQWEMAQYLIATTILGTVLGGIYFDPAAEEAADWAFNIALAAIGGSGIYYCFIVNRRIDDEEFIARFIVLSWPVTVRWILIAAAGYLIMAVSFGRYSEVFLFEDWFTNLYFIALEILYFWMLSNYIRLVDLSPKEN